MKRIKLNDITLREFAATQGNTLSFKEIIKVAQTLDKLNLDVISLPAAENAKIGSLLVHTITSAVSKSAVAMPVGMTEASLKAAWDAVKGAKHPRLYLEAPVSPVQMEFVLHKRPEKLLETITEIVSKAKELCEDVEFSALDATHADLELLAQAVKASIKAGASTVTVCDSAGTMFPHEFKEFISRLYEAAPELKDVNLAVRCSDTLSLAVSNALAALDAGAVEVNVSANSGNAPAIENLMKVISAREDVCDFSTSVKRTELHREMKQVAWITRPRNAKEETVFDTGVSKEAKEILLNAGDDISVVSNAVKALGYELSDDDLTKVFESFNAVSEKKSVGTKELEAIIASSAMQVPPTYKLLSYVINCGNRISATAVVHVLKDGRELQGMALGDGPIDAAFLAIEQITGRHYELDDFQIQAVTEGREAMGSTLIKLRSEGKLYSGNGISTDILGASIGSYINALNKIAFEEAQG